MEYKEVVSQLHRTSYFSNGYIFGLTIHAMNLTIPNVGGVILFERGTLFISPPSREQSLLMAEDSEKVQGAVTVTIVIYGEKKAHVSVQ
jgi:hypothetical protein